MAVATQILRAFASVPESDDYHIESITTPVKSSFVNQLIAGAISL
jgi:hypothetical protein